MNLKKKIEQNSKQLAKKHDRRIDAEASNVPKVVLRSLLPSLSPRYTSVRQRSYACCVTVEKSIRIKTASYCHRQLKALRHKGDTSAVSWLQNR